MASIISPPNPPNPPPSSLHTVLFRLPSFRLASRVQRLYLLASQAVYNISTSLCASPLLATHRNLPIEPALLKNERPVVVGCIANAAKLILNTPNQPLSVPEFDTSGLSVGGIETQADLSRLLPAPDTEFASGPLASCQWIPLAAGIRDPRLPPPDSTRHIQVSRPTPVGDKRSSPPWVG